MHRETNPAAAGGFAKQSADNVAVSYLVSLYHNICNCKACTAFVDAFFVGLQYMCYN